MAKHQQTNDLRTALYLLPFAIWCWLAMLLTHELGHVFAAAVTGGGISYVNVYPGSLPSTLVSPNPSPSIVLWGGFLSGWLIPQALALACSWAGRSQVEARCWAGFCWLVQGVYLAFGGLEKFADTALLIKQGWPIWLLAPVGVAAAVWGYIACRTAWPGLLRELSVTAPGVGRVGGIWVLLLVWVGAQYLLAGWLVGLAQG